MAKLIFGKVYYKAHFAGYLREEPGDSTVFTYDPSYLDCGLPAIAHTLPLQTQPFVHPSGLHPFFDNLVAEGWLEEAQTRLLGKRQASRFELLLAFGYDCAGAVSIVDPSPLALTQVLMDKHDPKEMALITSRASLSGVQPKLALIKRGGQFLPAKINELSTHIAKFPSHHHDDLVSNEYLTTRAFKALLPDDDVVDGWLGEVVGFPDPALIIKRFDREGEHERIHFEEFNQLLGRMSQAKYEGAYKDMATFIRQTPGCLPVEIFRLYLRILAGLLLGNTDMHFKNFALFHTPAGLRLTPAYDEVAAALYQYKTLALGLGGAQHRLLSQLKPSHIVKLGEEFQLTKESIHMACEQLAKRIEAAKEVILSAEIGTNIMKDQIITLVEKRWRGTFASIGKYLLQKRSIAANSKSSPKNN